MTEPQTPRPKGPSIAASEGWRSLVTKRNPRANAVILQVGDNPVVPEKAKDARESVHLVALRCVGCGANLQIASDIEMVACAHCGTGHAVERLGSTVALKRLGESVQRIQSNTDRVAAELALPRLYKELKEVEAERQRRLAQPVPLSNRMSKLTLVGLVSMFGTFYCFWKGYATMGVIFMVAMLGAVGLSRLFFHLNGHSLPQEDVDKLKRVAAGINRSCDEKRDRIQSQIDTCLRTVGSQIASGS